MTEEIAKVAAGLSEVQRDRLVSADPEDIDRFHYHHFRGRSEGLFQVARGWGRMEMSLKGLAVRKYLMETRND